MQELFNIFPNINIGVDKIPVKALAYIGDAVYELYVTTKIVISGPKTLKEMNEEAKKYVTAESQAKIYKKIEESLEESEIEVYKRGRNSHGNVSAKNATIVDYRMATGLEVLVGYLYLTKNTNRLNQIMKMILGEGNKINE